MWHLSSIKRLNDAKVKRRLEAVKWPKYGYTGSVSRGFHLRRDQTLLTFFIPPGPAAAQFKQHVDTLASDDARDTYISSLFPFRT